VAAEQAALERLAAALLRPLVFFFRTAAVKVVPLRPPERNLHGHPTDFFDLPSHLNLF
jgi:hypothetical protein